MDGAPCSCKRSCEEGSTPRCERFERWVQSSSAETLPRDKGYAELLQQEIPPLQLREVYSDVERTCPGLSYFQVSGGREKLTNVLKAWVAYDSGGSVAEGQRHDSVGYVQGMSAIASHLLWHAGEEEPTFWVFAAMMINCGLQGMFAPPDMAGLRMRIFILTQLLMEAMPDLGEHLAEHLDNDLGLVVTDWLVTLFAGYVPLDPLALLWDRFFKEGYTAVYRLVLARLRCLRPWLLAETDFTTLARLIKATHVDFHLDAGVPRPQLPETALVVTDDAAGQPAWTCLACNGSESCGSWHMLVALLAEERVWGMRVAELEKMYTGPRQDPGGAAASGRAAAGAAAREADYAMQPTDGRGVQRAVVAPAHFREYIFALEAENAQLRGELGQARDDLAQAQSDLARLQCRLSEAEGEVSQLRSAQ
ncbi:unnamed protein product [Prorocentrum cordatum]|uniref:Rab-GAP TBC domain-containing protein n=1 Tax=Prorocentrum cordatum TaxID=2364126 RepID=A0ABN9SDA1_9DINO|nr:unnamed protein product [Polarella glacialis]